MIQKFTDNGSFILGFGVFGNGPEFFTNPTGLAVNYENNIYVADFGNPTYAIKKFPKGWKIYKHFRFLWPRRWRIYTPGGLGVDKEIIFMLQILEKIIIYKNLTKMVIL